MVQSSTQSQDPQSTVPPTDTQSPREETPIEVNYTRPWLYPKQEHAIFYPRDVFGDFARFGLIEAATKTGKTVGCISWLFEQALFGKKGQNYWWVAPVYGQAKIAYTRMKTSYPDGTFDSNDGDLTLKLLLSGTIIWFKSGEKPDNLYGEDVYAAVIDEASRMREESWHAIRSTLTATRGPARFIGNVKGRKNWFFSLCRKAESGERGLSYHKIVASDAVKAGILADEEIASAKRDLPEQVFKELYLAEPSDDGGNPFGYEHIRKCVGPLSDRPVVFWGWDLAKSVDWTVGIGLDEKGCVARFERWQLPWTETTAKIIECTKGIPALVDSTGVGDPIVEALQKSLSGNFEGFKFTSQSKQQIMEGLSLAIQKSEIQYPEGPIVNELEQFEYEYSRNGVRYSAPEGFHDDCVCALALVNAKRTRTFAGWGVFEYYKREAAEVGVTRQKEILHSTSLNLADGAKLMKMPAGTSTAYGITGKSYFAGNDGTFVASGEDAEAFRKSGFQTLST